MPAAGRSYSPDGSGCSPPHRPCSSPAGWIGTLGNHTSAAPDVSEEAFKVLWPLLERFEPGVQVLGAIALDVLAHPVLAGDNSCGQFGDQLLPGVFRRTEWMAAQMAAQSGVGSGRMSAFVKRIGGESLAVHELLPLRNDDMVIGRGVVGLVALDLVDGAEEEVVVDHVVDGRIAAWVSTLMHHLSLRLCLEFLEHLGTGQL